MLKRVIITGKSGYIGNKIKEKLTSYPEEYEVSMISVKGDDWLNHSFAGTDIVIHTAGLVHAPDVKDWETYYRVNVELTEKLAVKAKNEGVSQFIFFSTMAVYGVEKELYPNYITSNTSMNPKSMYGKSKLQAEDLLLGLEDDSFSVAIIRPPIVYGKGCSGNYFSKLSKVCSALPSIPSAYLSVRQGFLNIHNLTELVKIIIDKKAGGCYMPQDEESICATDLLLEISKNQKKQKKDSKFSGYFVKAFSRTGIVKKVFGGVAYDYTLTNCFDGEYRIISLVDGLKEMYGSTE